MNQRYIGAACRAVAAATLAAVAVHGAETPTRTDAERLLEARQSEFEQAVIEVAEGVYTAVGFGVSPNSMIVGETGVVIVDTQIDARAAAGALAAFREITDLPVAAIVLTHGHVDHTGGLAVFAEGAEPQIWAGAGFGHEGRWASDAGLTALATDPQWTAELCDRLLALDPGDTAALTLKADALEALAKPLLTATGRNYYLTTAMQLRARAAGRASGPTPR